LALSERDRASRGLVVRDAPSALLTMRVEDLILRSALARVSKDEAAVRESWFETRGPMIDSAPSKDGEYILRDKIRCYQCFWRGLVQRPVRMNLHARTFVFFPGTNPATAAYRVIKPGRLP
jgi:hypothetical protein